MADVLGWVGAIGGLVGGGAGVVFGVLGYRAARVANRTAQKSREFAERGEQIGLKANALAGESNRIAVDARKLAEEANTISSRAEARETERHDVDWQTGWVKPGRYRIRNVGEDEAIRVRASVTVDGVQHDTFADAIPAGEAVELDFPEAREDLADEREERRRRDEARRANPGLFPGINPSFILDDLPNHWIGERFVWETLLGKPRLHEAEYRLTRLDDCEEF